MSNREIKFRAWHDPSKEMVYFDAVKAANDQYIAKHFFQLMAGTHSYGAGLLQYTGLKDKNGKDIYEGDIVGKCTQGRYWVVEWGSFGDTGYYAFNGLNSCRELEVDFDTVVFIPDQSEIIEALVVGNIYENPDLIGE